MIPRNMALFKFICVLYQFHRQTLYIMKIDGAKSNFESMCLQERNPNYQILRWLGGWLWFNVTFSDILAI